MNKTTKVTHPHLSWWALVWQTKHPLIVGPRAQKLAQLIVVRFLIVCKLADDTKVLLQTFCKYQRKNKALWWKCELVLSSVNSLVNFLFRFAQTPTTPLTPRQSKAKSPPRFTYLNTCWVPHLKISPKHFAMVTIAQFSASEQTHCTLFACDWMSECSFTQRILDIHQSSYSDAI